LRAAALIRLPLFALPLLCSAVYCPPGAEQLFTPHQARGEGYALAREEELATVLDTALSSGVILDPVYTGKALHELLSEMAANPDEWAGKRVCFIHTGGLLGCYDKTSQLAPLVEGLGRSHRLDVSGCS
jgi:D-cysteine desulfhydrase